MPWVIQPDGSAVYEEIDSPTKKVKAKVTLENVGDMNIHAVRSWIMSHGWKRDPYGVWHLNRHKKKFEANNEYEAARIEIERG